MDRQGFIGGTDAIRIMNGEWLELYQEKVGLTEPEDLSEVLAVQLGVHTERFNLNWWEQEYDHGWQLKGAKKHYQREIEVTGNGVPLKGTADMEVITKQNASFIVEAKHTNAFTNMATIIERYMPQIQLYMYLHKIYCDRLNYRTEGCYLSVIFGNSKWESKHISYDPEYVKSMMEKIREFWSHVVDKRPPGNRDAETPDISSIAIDRKVKMDMNRDNEWMSDAHDYVDTLESAKKNESAKKRLMSHIPPDVYQMDCSLLTVNITDKRRTIKVKEQS